MRLRLMRRAFREGEWAASRGAVRGKEACGWGRRYRGAWCAGWDAFHRAEAARGRREKDRGYALRCARLAAGVTPLSLAGRIGWPLLRVLALEEGTEPVTAEAERAWRAGLAGPG